MKWPDKTNRQFAPNDQLYAIWHYQNMTVHVLPRPWQDPVRSGCTEYDGPCLSYLAIQSHVSRFAPEQITKKP